MTSVVPELAAEIATVLPAPLSLLLGEEWLTGSSIVGVGLMSSTLRLQLAGLEKSARVLRSSKMLWYSHSICSFVSIVSTVVKWTAFPDSAASASVFRYPFGMQVLARHHQVARRGSVPSTSAPLICMILSAVIVRNASCSFVIASPV